MARSRGKTLEDFLGRSPSVEANGSAAASAPTDTSTTETPPASLEAPEPGNEPEVNETEQADGSTEA